MKNIAISGSFFLCIIWSATSTNERFVQWDMISLKHVDFQILSAFVQLSRIWFVDPTPSSQHSHPASNKTFLLVRFALVGNISLQALQMKVLILLHTLTAQIASKFYCSMSDWMIGHEKISVVEFGSSYMHFLPNIHLYLCMPKFGCLAPLYCSMGWI